MKKLTPATVRRRMAELDIAWQQHVEATAKLRDEIQRKEMQTAERCPHENHGHCHGWFCRDCGANLKQIDGEWRVV